MLVATAAAVLVACAQGTSPEELASQACEELPGGVPRERVEAEIRNQAEERDVDLADADLQAALDEVEKQCPKVLEEEPAE